VIGPERRCSAESGRCGGRRRPEADIYSAAFPDMHRELSDLYFDGDVVVVQLSLNGTHQGDLPMGLGTIPATAKEIHVPCVDVFHLEDARRN
jgi:predicted ester cyclase